ncbi:hypothetical protein BDR03DRAFT_952436 [Suillus americanus]|nr:hypothetical protein BDR03DRAFT_952436 [Suillus americanus]
MFGYPAGNTRIVFLRRLVHGTNLVPERCRQPILTVLELATHQPELARSQNHAFAQMRTSSSLDMLFCNATKYLGLVLHSILHVDCGLLCCCYPPGSLASTSYLIS